MHLVRNNIVRLPYLSVKPFYSTIYYKSFRDVSGTLSAVTKKPTEKSLSNLTRCKDSRFISDATRRKIKNACGWLIQFTSWHQVTVAGKTFDFRCAFVTLTLPCKQTHSDNEIKKICLNNFLTVLRSTYGLKYYVWRAEKQKNGNIHFHVVIDVAVHYAVIQRVWNDSLNLLGYIDTYSSQQMTKYKHGFVFDNESFKKYGTTREQQVDRYIKGLKVRFREPHTTEIKSAKGIRNLFAYMSKYISKKEFTTENENNEHLKVTGNIYGCSQNLLIKLEVENPPDIKLFHKVESKHFQFHSIYFVSVDQLANTPLRPLLSNLFV
jgi:hypothetical protein